jgi:hypothetical protein
MSLKYSASTIVYKGELMYRDLAQMSKARGIYRTLTLLAILSHKPIAHETNKYSMRRGSYKIDEQVDISDAGVKKGCVVSPR